MTSSARAKESPASAAEPWLRVGARFLDKYEIYEQIGHGAQARVYRGKHVFSGREIAIKVIHSAYGLTHEMLVRGRSEAHALGKLDHPSIVVMHDAGVTDEGLFYIVMELLRGRSLRAALTAHGRLGVEEVLRLAIQAGEALQAAHEGGLIHRDLKPDNIYLTRGNRLKVLDFGIAKMLNEIGFTTREDIVVGSLLYMSPEQIQGDPITPRSDMFALGLMMFEALLGKHPSLLVFECDLSARNEPPRRATLADIPAIQVNRMPPLLSDLDPKIPIHVARVVQRALAKLAGDRFSTMREFVARMRICLETCCGEPSLQQRRVGDRDLSLQASEGSEAPPASQRATAQWALVREGATSQSLPAAPMIAQAPVELVEVAEASIAVHAAPDDHLSASRRERLAATRATARASVRNAIIGGCLFGAALGTVGAVSYFGAPSQAASQARGKLNAVAGVSVTQSSALAAFSPATSLAKTEGAGALEPQPDPTAPAVGVTAGTPVVSSPALLGLSAPAVRSTALNPPTTRSRPRATVSARSIDKPLDRTPEDRARLASNGSKDSISGADEPGAKLGTGLKAIYGN